jgi:cytochrome c553
MANRVPWIRKPPRRASPAALFALLFVTTLHAAAPAPVYASRFEALRNDIIAGQVRSVEQLLPLLSYTMRSRFVLVFDSRSVQEASRPNPRVLLFGNDASFIVSFNGEAGQRGFDTVETMEFDAASTTYTLREIRFPEGTADATAAVEFSQANPARCAVCHGEPTHPIWDAYPLWPGVYGERYQRALSAPEAEGLMEFAQAQGAHPRYRTLEGFEVERFRGQLAPTQQRRYSGTVEEPPNAVLSALFGRLAVSVIEREVKASPRFADYRYALLWSLHPGCGDVTEALPAGLVASYARDFAPFARARKTESRLQAAHKSQRAASGGDGALLVSEDAVLDGFRYLAEQGLGLSTRHWTLALEQDNQDLAMQAPIAPQLESRLLASVADDDPKLLELRAVAQLSSDGKYCARLRRLSLEALKRPQWTTAIPSIPDSAQAAAGDSKSSTAVRPAGVGRCVACHVSAPVGPPIPFDDPVALSDQLRSRASIHGTLLDEVLFRLSPQAGNHRMPLDAVISTEEESALRLYFQSLARPEKRLR